MDLIAEDIVTTYKNSYLGMYKNILPCGHKKPIYILSYSASKRFIKIIMKLN